MLEYACGSQLYCEEEFKSESSESPLSDTATSGLFYENPTRTTQMHRAVVCGEHEGTMGKWKGYQPKPETYVRSWNSRLSIQRGRQIVQIISKTALCCFRVHRICQRKAGKGGAQCGFRNLLPVKVIRHRPDESSKTGRWVKTSESAPATCHGAAKSSSMRKQGTSVYPNTLRSRLRTKKKVTNPFSSEKAVMRFKGVLSVKKKKSKVEFL